MLYGIYISMAVWLLYYIVSHAPDLFFHVLLVVAVDFLKRILKFDPLTFWSCINFHSLARSVAFCQLTRFTHCQCPCFDRILERFAVPSAHSVFFLLIYLVASSRRIFLSAISVRFILTLTLTSLQHVRCTHRSGFSSQLAALF